MSDWLDAEAHADRAFDMFERGRWAEAETELRKALSLNPDQAEWHYNLGMTLEAAGRDLEALASYERAVELMGELVDPMVAAAAVCNRLGRHRHALQWAEQALGHESTHELAYAHRIDALVRLGEHDEAEAVFYMAEHALPEPSAHCYAAIAESLYERSDYERAGWCLKEALRVEPQMPRVRARLAAVLAATGKPQRALQMYLRDLRDDPGNIDTLLDYGEFLIDLGRMSEAGEKFRRVLEMEPANVDAHYRLGQIAMAAERFEQAHLEFELVLKLEPGFPSIRLALADVLVRRHQFDAARRCLREELDAREQSRTTPEDERTLRTPAPDAGDLARLGGLLLAADMPREAEPIIEESIEIGGENAAALRQLAVARFGAGDLDGGVAASRRVLRFDSRCVSSMHNLALAALKSGQYRVCAGWISRGLRIDRHDDGLRRLRVQLWIGLATGLVRGTGRMLVPRTWVKASRRAVGRMR